MHEWKQLHLHPNYELIYVTEALLVSSIGLRAMPDRTIAPRTFLHGTISTWNISLLGNLSQNNSDPEQIQTRRIPLPRLRPACLYEIEQEHQCTEDLKKAGVNSFGYPRQLESEFAEVVEIIRLFATLFMKITQKTYIRVHKTYTGFCACSLQEYAIELPNHQPCPWKISSVKSSINRKKKKDYDRLNNEKLELHVL